MQQALTAAGIASAIYYPIPLHLQEVYGEMCAGCRFPVAEQVAGQVLSLPMYPELTEDQINRICDLLLAVVE
ncbi:MAG: DegT/DnrJ/EryC1/StrS family aminotransferase [Desulfuromonadaceae bacterium]